MTQFQVELQKKDKSNVLRSKKTRNKVPHSILKRFEVKKKSTIDVLKSKIHHELLSMLRF